MPIYCMLAEPPEMKRECKATTLTGCKFDCLRQVSTYNFHILLGVNTHCALLHLNN